MNVRVALTRDLLLAAVLLGLVGMTWTALEAQRGAGQASTLKPSSANVAREYLPARASRSSRTSVPIGS
jgi:hypothetical protein